MFIGIGFGTAHVLHRAGDAPPPPPPPPPPPEEPTGLAQPSNLFTAAQSDLSDTAHINFKSNWQVDSGVLTQIQGNGSTNDVRIATPAPLNAGTPYCAVWDFTGGSVGRYRAQLGGNFSFVNVLSSLDSSLGLPGIAYWSSSDMDGKTPNELRFAPDDDDFDGAIGNIRMFDLGATDPHSVACDVFLCLGDSHLSSATSEFVSQANLTTPFDPRVWFMPHLKDDGGNYSLTKSTRHVPQPAIEPVLSNAARRMSPLMAFGAEMASWSAARGRPVLLLALALPGSGLNGSAEWDRDAPVVNGSEGTMWPEVTAMIDAVNALGPAHEIAGAIVSLGTNDYTGGVLDDWEQDAVDFVADLRTETGVASLPIVWAQVPDHYSAANDFPARMRAAQARLDGDSGSPVAQDGLKVIPTPAGYQLDPLDDTDPHLDAAGQQALGRAFATAMKTLL